MIESDGIYTTDESRLLLKISKSTMKRLLKRGVIRANKVGGQYRILGKEILRLVSPAVEKKAVVSYLKLKKKATTAMKGW